MQGAVMAGGWRLYEYYEQQYQEQRRKLPWHKRYNWPAIAVILVLVTLDVLAILYFKSVIP
jgi:hypothetical protein